MLYNEKCYEFTILLNASPYVTPIYLYRSILDTVEIIESSELPSLHDYLEETAMASLTTDIYTNMQWKEYINNRIKQKVKEHLP